MEILGPLHYITQHIAADQDHFLKMKVQENSQSIVIILNIEICWKIFNTFCFWGRYMWSAATIYLYTANYICNDILNINITFLQGGTKTKILTPNIRCFVAKSALSRITHFNCLIFWPPTYAVLSRNCLCRELRT